MRGNIGKPVFDKFVNAVIAFPPTARDGKSAQQVFQDSYALLDDLATNTPFPRALAWKGYALALSVYEGWPLPATAKEAALNGQQRLDEARNLTAAAIAQDGTDHDVHWAMADVHLIRQEFDDARKEFEIAVDLNRDERHPSLFAEAGSAMMQIGNLDKAQMYFRKARTPDWHHWMKGIMLFIKAGRAGDHQETFLNLALEELKGTRMQLGDDFYQHEIQLVLAAVHWRKWMLLSAKAAATKDPNTQALIQNYAVRNRTAAERAIRAFRATFPYWTDAQAATALPLQVAGDSAYWQDTVRDLWAIPP